MGEESIPRKYGDEVKIRKIKVKRKTKADSIDKVWYHCYRQGRLEGVEVKDKLNGRLKYLIGKWRKKVSLKKCVRMKECTRIVIASVELNMKRICSIVK